MSRRIATLYLSLALLAGAGSLLSAKAACCCGTDCKCKTCTCAQDCQCGEACKRDKPR